MSDNFTVRPVQRDDFTAWKLLWEGYNAFYGRKGETALPAQVTDMTWSRFFDGYEPVHAMVAEQANELIGLAHFILHRSTISIQPVCYLQDLFTSEASRSRGVGRALIRQVYQRAQNAGCGRVYWHTHETNSTAMKLYDKIAAQSGFVVYRKDM